MQKSFLIIILTLLLALSVQAVPAQEAAEESPAGEFSVEEPVFSLGDIEGDLKTDLEEEDLRARYITSHILTPEEVRPAIVYYVQVDIHRKFSGLVTNLKLEHIYGISQDRNIATIYFDYSYTSLRNKENVLLDKGKMTFMKFNSGKWFNEELSLFLMDSYPPPVLFEPEL